MVSDKKRGKREKPEAVGLGIARKSLHLPSQPWGHLQIPAPRPLLARSRHTASRPIPYNSPKKYALSQLLISVSRGLWGRGLHHWVPPQNCQQRTVGFCGSGEPTGSSKMLRASRAPSQERRHRCDGCPATLQPQPGHHARARGRGRTRSLCSC